MLFLLGFKYECFSGSYFLEDVLVAHMFCSWYLFVEPRLCSVERFICNVFQHSLSYTEKYIFIIPRLLQSSWWWGPNGKKTNKHNFAQTDQSTRYGLALIIFPHDPFSWHSDSLATPIKPLERQPK